MLFDTHAHLNFAAFSKNRDKIIKNCQKNNVWLINVGINYETSRKAVEIAEESSQGIYAAIGLHPQEILEERFDFEKYKNLAISSKKVKAIGEIGLDYWHKPKTKSKLAEFKQKQKELLLQEIKLAHELNLPIIFHCRMAHDDLIELLTRPVLVRARTRTGLVPLTLNGVIHCFTGTWQQAQKFLALGFYLGFNGIIFKKIKGISFNEVIKKTPLSRILIETDCPFLTPPQEGDKRNEPIFVKHIVQKIAEIKNISFEKIAKVTTQNAKKLFHI